MRWTNKKAIATARFSKLMGFSYAEYGKLNAFVRRMVIKENGSRRKKRTRA